MYSVVVLAEQAMTPADASEVTSLHETIEGVRHYHVLIPCDNAAARVESALGSLSASEALAVPQVAMDPDDIEHAQDELNAEAGDAVAHSVSALLAHGVEATGEFSAREPIDVLEDLVRDRQADEVIVMTRPHVVQEFLHLDWTSKARRHLKVPVLHLIEHEAVGTD